MFRAFFGALNTTGRIKMLEPLHRALFRMRYEKATRLMTGASLICAVLILIFVLFSRPFQSTLFAQSESHSRFIFTLPKSADLYKKAKTVRRWSASEVAAWMKENLNLTQKGRRFIISNDLNGKDIMDLDEEDMKELFSSAHDKRRYKDARKAIVKLRAAVLLPSKLRERSNTGIADLDESIPFVGRTAAVTLALDPVTYHLRITREYLEAEDRKELRQANHRLFAVGAPGIGKTRFGKEFLRLLAEHEKAPEDLKEVLKNALTVRITFIHGKSINEAVDLRWKTRDEQIDWILTSRAIYATYQVESEYDSWAKQLAESFGDRLPKFFNLKTFTRTLHKTHPDITTLYFHMDEVQTVLSPLLEHIGTELIRSVTNIYTTYNTKDLFTLLLFTGTTFLPITEMLHKVGFGNSPSFPLVTLPMETLSDDQIKQIFREMKQQNKLPWLCNDWETNVPFMKLLALTGGVPRIIEELLDLGNRGNNTYEIAKALPSRINLRYNLSNNSSALTTACNLALAATIEDEKLIENLRANGYLFWSRDDVLDVPLLYLEQSNLIKTIFADVSNEQLLVIWSQTVLPHGELRWKDFEWFTLLHTVLRVGALIDLGHKTVTVANYFRYATSISQHVRLIQIKLEPRSFVDLENSWPESGWPKCQHSTLPLSTSNITSYVFLNAAGSACDGFEFVQIVADGTPKYLVFAHQNKYTADGKTTLKPAEIHSEVKKVERAFTLWKTKETKDKELNKLKQATEKVVLVIYSNSKEGKEKSNTKTSNQSEVVELIEMNNPAHFGPLCPLLKFFQFASSKYPRKKEKDD